MKKKEKVWMISLLWILSNFVAYLIHPFLVVISNILWVVYLIFFYSSTPKIKL